MSIATCRLLSKTARMVSGKHTEGDNLGLSLELGVC